MGGRTWRTRGALASAGLVLFFAVAAGAVRDGAAAERGRARGKEEGVRLEEVRIVGSAERPGVLFFLPRPRFRLLPLRDPGGNIKERLLRDDKMFGERP